MGIGMSVGLVLTIAITTYLLVRDRPVPRLAEASASAARTITLRVTPPWANVKLDGLAAGPADGSGKVLLRLPEGDPSKHWIEIAADGHHSDRRPLAMFAGVDYAAIELIRKPYELAVRTEPDQAEVWINDKLKGFSPLTLSLAAQEEATLSVKRRGYEPLTQPVSPPERGERLELNLTLKPLGPILRVETDPPGANVMIDGVSRGAAPVAAQLDASALGEALEVVASSPGYDDATTRIVLPRNPGEEADAVQLTLRRTRIEVEVVTAPPGGRIIIEGRDLGPAPVVAKFDPAQIGRPVVVQASLAGSHFGRQDIVVPPAGERTRVNIPMEFNAQRVVLVLALSPERAAENVALTDRALESIHDLTAQQRFAILIRTEDGVEAWPGGLGTEAATSEQKVRAYDVLRSLRPNAAGSLRETLKTALGFKPTTIWLLTSRKLEREELRPFAEAARGMDLSVHVVISETAGAGAAAGGEAWLAEWTASQNGTLTVLGDDKTAPVALDADQDAP